LFEFAVNDDLHRAFTAERRTAMTNLRPDRQFPPTRLRTAATSWATALAFLLTLLAAGAVSAQPATYTKIYDFTGSTDGGHPQSGLVKDNYGGLWGMTTAGGAGFGTVFNLAPHNGGWIFRPLYQFAGAPDGAGSISRPLLTSNGLYGPTIDGGSGTGCNDLYPGCGTVFVLRPQPRACVTALCPWIETTLYSFPGGNDGAYPYGDLTIDAAGSLYGGTWQGGAVNQGVIYKLSNGDWAETILHTFNGGINDGSFPQGGVIFDNNGNLYGTARQSGAGFGIVFQLQPAGPPWTFHILYSFTGGSDGGIPQGGLIMDASGNLYGTTSFGGMGNGGTVFELSPSGGGWHFNLLCYLPAASSGPQASLVMDHAGNLYGTTYAGGTHAQGAVFKATTGGGACTDLYDFTGGMDGGHPWDGLVLNLDGNLYGTTQHGGASNNCSQGCGVIFQITP
jgi:uncharacterized repeat protein (TIGR03803 family)